MKKPNKKEILSKTRVKISKDWQTYREKKQSILTRKLGSMKKQELIKNLLTSTRVKVSEDFTKYRITVYNKDISKPFIKQGEKEIKTGFEEKFKVKKSDSKNLYKSLQKVKRFKNLRYILVIVELYNIDSDSKQFISQTFTNVAIERIDENVLNDIVNQFILKNSNTSQIDSNYTIKNVFIRLIYENTKTNNRKKQNKKLRKN